MSKQILAFGASNSKNSINQAFAKFTGNLVVKSLPNFELNTIDLNDFEMPIYSIDRENVRGIPKKAKSFKAMIDASDGIIISLAEHNGAYTAAYKNIYDWVSRIDKNVWQNKPMLLLSTSPGPRGASLVLNLAHNTYKYANKNKIPTFSLPSFQNNFSTEKGISHPELLEAFKAQALLFKDAL